MNRRLEKDAAGDECEEGTGYMGACGAAGQREGGGLTSLTLFSNCRIYMIRISGLRCWSGAPKKVQMEARNLKSTTFHKNQVCGSI